jgi:hypothetical protein
MATGARPPPAIFLAAGAWATGWLATADSADVRYVLEALHYTADLNEIKALGGDGITTPSARLFGLLNMALADGYIGSFDTMYRCRYGRPVSAIRAADSDPKRAPERSRTRSEQGHHPHRGARGRRDQRSCSGGQSRHLGPRRRDARLGRLGASTCRPHGTCLLRALRKPCRARSRRAKIVPLRERAVPRGNVSFRSKRG